MQGNTWATIFGYSKLDQENTLFLSWNGRKEVNRTIQEISGSPNSPIFAVLLSEDLLGLLCSKLSVLNYRKPSEQFRDLHDIAYLYYQVQTNKFEFLYYSKNT